MSALVEGLIAGYGIAIPLGAVSVLIVNKAIDEGFRSGFSAGAGTATVDALCATTVVFAGLFVSSMLAPYETHLQLIGGVALILMGVLGAMKVWRTMSQDVQSAVPKKGNIWRTYLQFIVLTSVNPFTVIYFLALIMGGSTSWMSSMPDCLMFIIGVTFASLSWQTLLAAGGAMAQKRLNMRAKVVTIIVGNVIVVLLGIKLMMT